MCKNKVIAKSKNSTGVINNINDMIWLTGTPEWKKSININHTLAFFAWIHDTSPVKQAYSDY